MMQELVRTYTLSMPNLCYESDIGGLTCFLFRPLLWERKAARAKTRLYGKGPVNRCELAMDHRLLKHVSNAAELIFRRRSMFHIEKEYLARFWDRSVYLDGLAILELSGRVKFELDEVRRFGISRPAWHV